MRLVQRGPVNGAIAGDHRDWSPGSLVLFSIVLQNHPMESSLLLYWFLTVTLARWQLAQATQDGDNRRLANY